MWSEGIRKKGVTRVNNLTKPYDDDEMDANEFRIITVIKYRHKNYLSSESSMMVTEIVL